MSRIDLVSPVPNSRSLSKRIGLLLIAVLIAWIAFSVGWRYLRAQFPSPNKVSVSPYSENVPPRIGNINGTPISVPAHYLFFPMEYMGESVWEPRKDKPVRTFDNGIGNFAIYVQWPALNPRSPKNEPSYQESIHNWKAHDWIMVGVQANPPTRVANGYANSLRYDIENKIDNYRPLGNPRYEMRGLDPKLGLNSAVPVGPGTERRSGWNLTLYWAGNAQQSVPTYIQCSNGSFTTTGLVTEAGPAARCTHEFQLPELKADIRATYTINLLPHWRAIESEVRKLILSFQSSQSNAH